MHADTFAAEFERIRPDLAGYLPRLLASTDAAEDIVQSAAVRALAALKDSPADHSELRAWLFRIATNLAIDELRRRRRWNENALVDVRPRAEGDAAFAEFSAGLRGSAQMRLIAKEHLAACFVCTLRTLPPERSAALLLREVYAFSIDEAAIILDARPTQVKNWIQEARRIMHAQYEDRCALIRKDGVCYQCVELSDFFNGDGGNPLAGSSSNLSDRLRIVNELRDRPLGAWHRRLFSLFDDFG